MNQRELFNEQSELETAKNIQGSQFDYAEGEALKTDGMALAADNRVDALGFAKNLAKEIATDGDGTCHADLVSFALEDAGMEQLGPAAGSLFKGREWEFTGRRIASCKISNHARELKVWRLQLWRG